MEVSSRARDVAIVRPPFKLRALPMRSSATVVLAFTATMASPVLAEPVPPEGTIRLTWNAPEGCPPTEAVLADVRRNLGGSRPRSAVVPADVTMLAPERWSVHIVTFADDTPGERSF